MELRDRIARAIRTATDDGASTTEDYIDAVIEELRLTRENEDTQCSTYLEDRGHGRICNCYAPSDLSPRHRYVTPWKGDDE